jgi:hypothetical protein
MPLSGDERISTAICRRVRMPLGYANVSDRALSLSVARIARKKRGDPQEEGCHTARRLPRRKVGFSAALVWHPFPID